MLGTEEGGRTGSGSAALLSWQSIGSSTHTVSTGSGGEAGRELETWEPSQQILFLLAGG